MANSGQQVLIVGGGPVGLALALDLGWRGVRCLLVEQNDGMVEHPRANAINVRSMEFCRRWGIADRVREAGPPPDFPHTAVYLTSLTGYEIARIERSAHGGTRPSPYSPERPQRCNQLWFDPILRERAAGYPAVALRYGCRFESFVETPDGVTAVLTDVASGRKERVAANYLVACCGGRSSIRKALGIEVEGEPVQGYPVDIFFRAPDLWSLHDKGKAALHFLVGPAGVWASLNSLDGRELWRLTIHGTTEYLDPATLDIEATLRRAVGTGFPHEVISVMPWVRREIVARSFGRGRVFLAGDCAHQNSPSGGHGMNTGLGDATNLGWKLAAAIEGWAGPRLLESYTIERRPVARRNAGEATHNFRFRHFCADEVDDDSERGRHVRAELRARFLDDSKRRFGSFGIALGYSYAGSPVICAENGALPPDTDVGKFVPSAAPGFRAPHARLTDGRSLLDLFGQGFVLLRFDTKSSDTSSFEAAARRRNVPLAIQHVSDPAIAGIYERRFVLVRPDGHVAWHGDEPPPNPMPVIDRVRGAESGRPAIGQREEHA